MVATAVLSADSQGSHRSLPSNEATDGKICSGSSEISVLALTTAGDAVKSGTIRIAAINTAMMIPIIFKAFMLSLL